MAAPGVVIAIDPVPEAHQLDAVLLALHPAYEGGDVTAAYWTTQRLSPQFTADIRANLQTVLDESTVSRRLLHDQLARELASIDRQEENLLDLAANATMTTDKVRTRLTRLQAQRKQIQHRLADTGNDVRQGAAVLHAQFDLLQHPDRLYRNLNDHGRRLLNQAIFDELLIDQDPDDQAIHIAGQTYTEPVRDLMTAARTHRHQNNPAEPSNGDRPAVNGQTDPNTAASLFQPHPQDRVWNKAAMVELRGFEPLTPSMRTRCATRLRYSPHYRAKVSSGRYQSLTARRRSMSSRRRSRSSSVVSPTVGRAAGGGATGAGGPRGALTYVGSGTGTGIQEPSSWRSMTRALGGVTRWAGGAAARAYAGTAAVAAAAKRARAAARARRLRARVAARRRCTTYNTTSTSNTT
jgi:hypothetical protein